MKKSILAFTAFLGLLGVIAVAHAAVPTVSAGVAQTITLPTSSVTLTGSATATAPQVIAGYNWSQVSGPVTGIIAAPALASTLVSGLVVPGNYVFALSASDNSVPIQTSSSNVTITVNPVQTPSPIVRAPKMKLEINENGKVNLQGALDAINGTVFTVKVYGISITVNTDNAKFGSLANDITLYKIGDSVKVEGSLDQSASTLTVNAKKVGNQNINKINDKKDREGERKQEDEKDHEDGNKFPSLDKHNQDFFKNMKDGRGKGEKGDR